jgi:hypothetical protein
MEFGWAAAVQPFRLTRRYQTRFQEASLCRLKYQIIAGIQIAETRRALATFVNFVSPDPRR